MGNTIEYSSTLQHRLDKDSEMMLWTDIMFDPPITTAGASEIVCAAAVCATHCNMLQHMATHCNILQHTATHCNAPWASLRSSLNFLRVYVCVHVYLYVSVYVRVDVNMRLHKRVRVYVRVHVHVHVNLYVHVHLDSGVCVYVCVV